MFYKKSDNNEGLLFDHLSFPAGFLWGTAISSHQAEGGNFNDWTEWEIKHAKIKNQSVKLTDWPDYILEKYPNPLREENYISGRACDHYNRYEEDFDIVKNLGNNAFRFSIEWSRVEPREGEWDQKEIEHYRNVLRALRDRNIKPFVTLWHWTNPVWFAEKGGFENKNAPFYFVRYAEKIIKELGDLADFWITINEPLVVISFSYLKGVWPPQKKSLFAAYKVFRNLIRSHKAVYEKIKKIKPELKIGIAYHMRCFEAYGNKFFNKVLRNAAHFVVNRRFLERVGNYQDFIGLNYYGRNLFNFNILRSNKIVGNENKIFSDMGWEIYPEGIYHILKDLKKYNLPIYITENGVADARDKYRADFIKEHLYWIWRAINDKEGVDPVRSSATNSGLSFFNSEAASPSLWQIINGHRKTSNGVDVRGYFYWSLLDNFEWDKGFWPRFGLVEVDYKTMERKIRNSAREYAEICKNNGFFLKT